MCERQFLKYVAFLDDIRQGEVESLASYCSHFNKKLVDIY